ncbi:TonB-dependent receptor plug domain-containing protein [Pokkaliibacter sp. CJK22405]|uniref:TonB-dependent receptor plug domain-containing protein n=1 Tax=Pokkaliibacter sp. CJK22405 TaxID=3384615 RepID=UPI003985176D
MKSLSVPLGTARRRSFATPFALSALTLLISSTAHALTLDELVISASRAPQDENAVGSSVTVLTREELERRQITRVADALKALPGVNVIQQSTPGSLTNVRLRGLSQRFVQIVVDGVPINDPSTTDGSADIGSLLVNDIERIEIVRGPQSALWGSDTIGGVVHIITRSGGKNQTHLRAEVGDNHTQTLGISGQGTSGNGRVEYGYGLSGINAHPFSSLDSDMGNHERDGQTGRQASGRLKFNMTDDWDLRLNLSHNFSRLDYDGYDPVTFTQTDNGDRADSEINSARLETNFSALGGDLENRIGFSHSTTLRNYLNASGDYDYDGSTNQLDYQGQYHFGISALPSLDNSVIVALEHKSADFESTYSDHQEDDSDSWVAEYRADIGDDINLSLSHREDDNHNFNNTRTSRVAASWNLLPDTRLHTSYGTGVKNPSLYQLFDAYSGNSELTAQKSQGGDIGLEQKLGDWVVDATWFSNRVKNQIDYSYTTYRYYNADGITRSSGLELSAKGKVTDQLDLNLSYTYTDVDNDQDRSALLRQPWHEASLYADYRFSGMPLAVNTGITYRGSREDTGDHNMPAYTLVNVAGRYDLDDTWQLTARVENLFNHEYEELYGYGTQDRAFYLGINANF